MGPPKDLFMKPYAPNGVASQGGFLYKKSRKASEHLMPNSLQKGIL